jgi:hypothetical protein
VNGEDRVESLVELVLSGENRDLELLAARGLLPLPLQELLPLQLKLTQSENEDLAAVATEALEDLAAEIVIGFLAETSEPEFLSFFAQRTKDDKVKQAVVQHRSTPPEVLSEMAAALSPELQEILLLRQDAILQEPMILDRLESNPDLSTFARRRITEYREHLLPRERPIVTVPEVELEEEDEITEAEIEAAIAAAQELPAEGERDESTGLSEAQIRTLPVPVRLKLSRGASRALRGILIRDKNPMVAVSVIRGNSMSDAEIEMIASNRSVVDEVLDLIARDRQWGRKYSIRYALVRNPRTPVGLAARLVPQLSVKDLRLLSRDHNVSEVVRSTAKRLYRIKAN